MKARGMIHLLTTLSTLRSLKKSEQAMNDEGPARLIGVYGGTCFLVYVETNGFNKASAAMFALPLVVLSFLALTSTMQPKAKFTTAGTFAILGMVCS
ncbi:hypothetical protein Aduo_002550 [Ancylostoma duodenale]